MGANSPWGETGRHHSAHKYANLHIFDPFRAIGFSYFFDVLEAF